MVTNRCTLSLAVAATLLWGCAGPFSGAVPHRGTITSARQAPKDPRALKGPATAPLAVYSQVAWQDEDSGEEFRATLEGSWTAGDRLRYRVGTDGRLLVERAGP